MHNDLFSVNKLPAVKEISGFRDKVMEYIDKNKDKITDKQWMLAYKQLTFFDNDIVE
jgi:hypothetical protein